MKLEDLTFGSYREIEPKIVEVIINEGVELDDKMIKQAETALLDTFGQTPYALLVSRIYPYSHSMGSLTKVPKMANLAAIAIVVYSELSKHTARIHKIYQENVRVFDNKEDALIWLKERV